jgi:large subunit ribosomal protein L21
MAAVGAGSATAVAAPAAKPAKAAAAKAKAAPKSDAKPTAAAPAASDDLKKLDGVGPKMAATMAEAGIHSFAQMAAWTDDEAAAMDETLGAKGKLAGWIAQAKTLAEEK